MDACTHTHILNYLRGRLTKLAIEIPFKAKHTCTRPKLKKLMGTELVYYGGKQVCTLTGKMTEED